jgi:phosphoribosyl-ATP pyrophosphohydrolase
MLGFVQKRLTFGFMLGIVLAASDIQRVVDSNEAESGGASSLLLADETTDLYYFFTILLNRVSLIFPELRRFA